QYNHLLRTPLTSVSQCSTEMGRVAVQLMLDLFAGRPIDARHVIPTRLVEAASVAPPRALGQPDIVS
ncbi:MAG: substrate-binding domain-containing protein, partial [Planctomycetota bacterium]